MFRARPRPPSAGKIFKLSSNETALGPSPRAIEAFESAADSLPIYPDGSAGALREAIGARHGLDPARIVCGAGSDELIFLLAYAFLNPGDEGIYTRHGFSIYRIAILAAGGTPVVADEVDLTANVDAILAKVTPKTKIVFLANPNNPTGTYLPAAEIKRLADRLPPHVLLILDAAYAEFVTRADYEPGLELARTREECRDDADLLENLRSRGAAARLVLRAPAPVMRRASTGCAARSTSIRRRMRAGIAAVGDQEHVELSIAHNRTWLALAAPTRSSSSAFR